MWSSADVSGHARSTLPCPTIRSNADSVLSVHFEVTDVHILEDGIWGCGGRDTGRYGKISKAHQQVRGREEEQTQEAIKKDEKTVEEERDTIKLLIRDSFFINVESNSYQAINVYCDVKAVMV